VDPTSAPDAVAESRRQRASLVLREFAAAQPGQTAIHINFQFTPLTMRRAAERQRSLRINSGERKLRANLINCGATLKVAAQVQ
jgi:hypothetical protein